ncbi:50S ribosome-binding GTPase, partial [bacterium]|nr:50S ribosome-binding GTPase [bacterium]
MARSTFTFALAGNPNSGKTTLFNALTGSAQKVGNWPGVTIEKKIGRYKHDSLDIRIVDLPGTYSLSPYSLEERITRQFLLDEKPDVVIQVLDVTNLERSLFLTTQLIELGQPVVLALNVYDEFERSGARVHVDKLVSILGTPAIPTVAVKGEGLDKLIAEGI